MDISKYFNGQIQILNTKKPVFYKTVVVNGEPLNQEWDTVNWEKELEIFKTIDINKESLKGKYAMETDSSGPLVIQRFYTWDSALDVQEISITRVKDEIQLIEAKLRKRSLIVDRDMLLSYQPLKGYGIKMNEDYIWSKPGTHEIFMEIIAPGYINNKK